MVACDDLVVSSNVRRAGSVYLDGAGLRKRGKGKESAPFRAEIRRSDSQDGLTLSGRPSDQLPPLEEDGLRKLHGLDELGDGDGQAKGERLQRAG